MSVGMRKYHDAVFKARVALEAIKEERTLAQLSVLFSERKKASGKAREEHKTELHQHIGQLKVIVMGSFEQ